LLFAWIMILLPMPPAQLGCSPMPHIWLICWDAVSLFFCLSWLQRTILSIFASQVAGITGVSHHTWH
jgi:hypothetical protein